ncbi:serine/threonine-protein kinase pakD-like protein [Trifolium pratense]|uniref:Serine/threonine-protein kinase pakD-like protein n=1 Tax=Trifolium pratense TaxID=57577 RepID=A0A2K3JZY4_TRIPR|nr:serine/threonine-protein kinase pakD-like protein [Trifolium pratense]
MSGKVGGQKGSSLSGIPAASRKMVQSLKEIVTNIPDNEIYATLKDCNMDPNEAVSRLLSQDPFHEVKSKREKKKEVQFFYLLVLFFNLLLPFVKIVKS